MITEQRYKEYTKDFNSTFVPRGMSLGDFFDKYYEPEATFVSLKSGYCVSLFFAI